MASVFCTSCGAPGQPGATFCSYCGSALVGAPQPAAPPPLAAPLPEAAPPVPPGGFGYRYPPAAPPRRRRMWVVGLVVLLVAVSGLGVAAFLLPSPPMIYVTGINFVSPDNACGLAGATDYGFNATGGQSMEFTYDLYNELPTNATQSCSIVNITTTTPGFSVTGANTPLTIPAGLNSTQTFSFQVNLPSTDYTGVLTLELT